VIDISSKVTRNVIDFVIFTVIIKTMRKFLLALIVFWLSAFTSQSTDYETASAFQGGEWLKVRIHYGWFNASYATLEVRDEIHNGKEVFHVIGHGRTTGLASVFFKVDDNYESYFDKRTGKPYKFIRKIDEGGHTKDVEINFDYDNNKATLIDHKRDSKQTFKIQD